MVKKLLVYCLVFLLFGCGADTPIDYSKMVAVWKTSIVTKEGKTIGDGYYIFEKPNNNVGRTCQVIPEKGGLYAICTQYKVTSSRKSGRVVYFEENALIGWINLRFKTVGYNNNQALIRDHAYFKVYDETELLKVRDAVSKAQGK